MKKAFFRGSVVPVILVCLSIFSTCTPEEVLTETDKRALKVFHEIRNELPNEIVDLYDVLVAGVEMDSDESLTFSDRAVFEVTADIPYTFNVYVNDFGDFDGTNTETLIPYAGIIPKGLFTIKDTGEDTGINNLLKIVIDRHKPTVYLNDILLDPPVRTDGGSTDDGGSGNGDGGGTGSPTTEPEVVIDEIVKGDSYEQQGFSFTLPAGIKSMTIRTTENNTTAYRNTADLFVRRGSAPLVAGPTPPTNTPAYTWTADCHGINPNREDEVCTFSNPGAGTWYVVLYGYNTYFSSQVIISITE